jgi:putative ABC transport system permease protein
MRLAENADLTAVQHNINQVIRSNRSQLIGGYLLQPVGRIHLFSHVQQELNPQGNFRVVLLFAGIGLLVLLMAIINYTNLALAKSVRRMQEIGIRKAIGAQTNQIRVQFLAESLLYALVSLPFALVLVQVTIPVINNLFGLSLPGGFQVGILIMGLIILLVTGCIAGLYPAIFLSKQNPEHGLKQGAWRGSNRSHFRKVLLGIQFLLSGMLLFTTITLMQQMKFLQTEEVGFQAENLVSFRRGALPVDSYPAFRHELLSHTAVMNATHGPVPGLGFVSNEYAFSTTKKGYEQLHSQYVGKEYVETLGLSLISGQSFTSPEVQQTANPVILNEAAAVLYDITPEKVGQSMSHILFGNITVVGIVTNYHNASLYHPIQPVLLKWEPDRVSDILVRLDHRNVKSGLEHIRSVWASYVSDVPLQFSFVDERIQRQYQAERQLAHLFNWFGGLAILLALIGLFGLAGYSVERRTKEFGIRRVLGATGSHLLMLISGEFSSIILVALLIALPLAAVLMNLWLDNFAYHVILGPEIFLITILGLLFCTGIALVGPVIRSMLANPVDTLRYE